MAARYDILLNSGIVYIAYSDRVSTAESLDMLARMGADPDYSIAFRHLCDLRYVTDHPANPVEMMIHQASISDFIDLQGQELLLVILVESEQGREIANVIRKSWEGITGVIPVMAESEVRALQLLGQPERTLADLFDARAKES